MYVHLFQNRFKHQVIAGAGAAVCNIARRIPGGVLVFFPSYTVMESMMNQLVPYMGCDIIT